MLGDSVNIIITCAVIPGLIDLKRVYISAYALKKLGTHQIKAKNCKNLKNTKGLKSTSKTKDEKNFLILGFF